MRAYSILLLTLGVIISVSPVRGWYWLYLRIICLYYYCNARAEDWIDIVDLIWELFHFLREGIGLILLMSHMILYNVLLCDVLYHDLLILMRFELIYFINKLIRYMILIWLWACNIISFIHMLGIGPTKKHWFWNINETLYKTPWLRNVPKN